MKNIWIYPIEKNRKDNEPTSGLGIVYSTVQGILSGFAAGYFVTSMLINIFLHYGLMGLQAGYLVWTCGSLTQLAFFMLVFTIAIPLAYLIEFVFEIILQYIIEGFSFVYRKTKALFTKVSTKVEEAQEAKEAQLI